MSGTTYTPSLRFAIMTPGDPAVRNQWGTVLDNYITVDEQAITGNAAISINGLTAYTLTTANNASDQARQQLYPFTGTLTGDCTVTLPSVPKVGWAQNGTTGGYNVILTTGGGRTITIASGLTYWYTCDGTNVDAVTLGAAGFGITNLSVPGTLSVTGATTLASTLAVTGATTLSSTLAVTGALTAATAGTTGNQVVNFNQFNPTASANGFIHLPGGVTLQWGNSSTSGAGTAAITFPVAFSSGPWAVNVCAVQSSQPLIGSVASSPAATGSGFTAQCNTIAGAGAATPFYWSATGPT
jgi:hypothetical protein